jgi:hypothetical protein
LKPSFGVLIELAALGVCLSIGWAVPSGPLTAVYVLALESVATYLVHCPAHYVVGRFLGIRFRSIRMGHSSIAGSLPESLKGSSRLLVVPTLSVQKGSLSSISGNRASAMYASGTIASVVSPFIIAGWAALSLPTLYSLPGWAFAVGYLVLDAIFSPKTGDFSRARRSRSSAGGVEPVKI